MLMLFYRCVSYLGKAMFFSKATNVLLLLGRVASYALTLTGFFYRQVTPDLKPEDCLKGPQLE